MTAPQKALGAVSGHGSQPGLNLTPGNGARVLPQGIKHIGGKLLQILPSALAAQNIINHRFHIAAIALHGLLQGLLLPMGQLMVQFFLCHVPRSFADIYIEWLQP